MDTHVGDARIYAHDQSIFQVRKDWEVRLRAGRYVFFSIFAKNIRLGDSIGDALSFPIVLRFAVLRLQHMWFTTCSFSNGFPRYESV